ncbi:Lipoyltransferase and lipoate-protein ligase [Irpex rosettiformis]|uniref:Lipoyltransferase and lipoate-protein ligase n=1 Tax=Irpex rosettiformis TaxID=378272 RepID=A0ACB8UC57_9APHY|nr:Lipoyltransferase and lipoate-protein ligase [Irpex rosettiformis]
MQVLHYARRSITRWSTSRLFFTTTALHLDPNHSIYVSNSTNPYFNLSLEDWLFRHKNHKEPLLLLYRDSPCVVIGRNQNPWKEVNLSASSRTGIPFIRRRSGGGTVYHDYGNTNFSIHLSRTSFDRHATAQVVLRAVRSLDIDANVNDRNDICVGKDKIISYKHVSGSAYKIVNNRAYHHGTMLISTQLNTLGDLLRTSKTTMDTKGVASVRSPVCNLQQYNPSVNHDKFVEAVIKTFREEYSLYDEAQTVGESEETAGIEYIRSGMEELPEWEWAFGQTPEFTYTIQQFFVWGEVTAQIHSKHGRILSCNLECANSTKEVSQHLLQLSESLKGQKYAFVEKSDLGDVGLIIEKHQALADVWHWLQNEMTM